MRLDRTAAVASAAAPSCPPYVLERAQNRTVVEDFGECLRRHGKTLDEGAPDRRVRVRATVRVRRRARAMVTAVAQIVSNNGEPFPCQLLGCDCLQHGAQRHTPQLMLHHVAGVCQSRDPNGVPWTVLARLAAQPLQQ